MAYYSKSIIKDVNDKPVPQYWNSETNRFEVIESNSGKLRVSLINSDGSNIVSQNLIDQITDKLDELIGVVSNNGL